MAYNPYESIRNIYNLKKQWDEANKSGDTITANSVANNAKQYYEDLKTNGYETVAKKLSNVDYAGAKSIHDSYATAGKTAIRPYFETLANANNLSTDDINGLINYNDKTKRVSFAGTDIGTPDAVVDGVSYWDKDYLKGVWDGYMKDSKLNDYNGVKGNATYSDRMESASAKNDEQYNQLNEHNSYIRDEYDKLLALANTPYSESEEYKAAVKSVMPYYDYAGQRAAYGAVADGASTNGGNVDTFAAANARRQRNAQISQGAQMAYQLGLAPYQQRIENISNILSSIGAQRESVTGQQNSNIANDMTMAQMAFDNGEAQKLNEHAMSEEKLNNEAQRDEIYGNLELAKATLDANTALGFSKLTSKGSGGGTRKSNDEDIVVADISEIPNTLKKSASDSEERKVLPGYSNVGLNNLSARFINEKLYSQRDRSDDTISAQDVVDALNTYSDSYGLTQGDAIAILSYLGLNGYITIKEREKGNRTDVPGVDASLKK